MIPLAARNKLVFLHLHTSGIGDSFFGVVSDYQPISIALNIVDLNLNPIDKFHKLIKSSSNYAWDNDAVKIHGLDKEILEEFGNDLKDVSDYTLTFLSKHFDLVNDTIKFVGFNIEKFHYLFFSDLINPTNNGITLKNRLYDIDFMLLMDEIYTNKEMFKYMNKIGYLTSSEINSLYIEYVRSKIR